MLQGYWQVGKVLRGADIWACWGVSFSQKGGQGGLPWHCTHWLDVCEEKFWEVPVFLQGACNASWASLMLRGCAKWTVPLKSAEVLFRWKKCFTMTMDIVCISVIDREET